MTGRLGSDLTLQLNSIVAPLTADSCSGALTIRVGSEEEMVGENGRKHPKIKYDVKVEGILVRMTRRKVKRSHGNRVT